MKIQSTSKTVEQVAIEASTRIKESIDRSLDMSDDEKEKAKKAVDETSYVSFEVPDTKVYRMAIASLAIAAGLIVLGALILTFNTIEVPDFLQVTLATIIGALAGMIVPSANNGL